MKHVNDKEQYLLKTATTADAVTGDLSSTALLFPSLPGASGMHASVLPVPSSPLLVRTCTRLTFTT